MTKEDIELGLRTLEKQRDQIKAAYMDFVREQLRDLGRRYGLIRSEGCQGGLYVEKNVLCWSEVKGAYEIKNLNAADFCPGWPLGRHYMLDDFVARYRIPTQQAEEFLSLIAELDELVSLDNRLRYSRFFGGFSLIGTAMDPPNGLVI